MFKALYHGSYFSLFLGLLICFGRTHSLVAFWEGMQDTEIFSVLSSPKMLYSTCPHLGWPFIKFYLENFQGIVPLSSIISNCYWNYWEVWFHYNSYYDSYFILCASFSPLMLLGSLFYPVYPEILPNIYLVYSLCSH